LEVTAAGAQTSSSALQGSWLCVELWFPLREPMRIGFLSVKGGFTI